MEHMGAISEGVSSSQNAEFMAFPLYNTVPSIFWPCHGSTMDMAGLVEDSYHSSDLSSSILYSPSHSSRNSLTQKGYYMSHDSSMSMDFCMADVKKSSLFLIEGDGYLNLEMSGEDAEECASFLDPMSEDNNPPEKPKKRSRTSEDVKKNIRVQQAMMNQKLASTSKNEDDNNGELNGQSSSSCSSEDDSNVCQKQNGVTLSLITKGPADSNPNGKTRAKRGSTTDLQSLHARKRRERINARLKTLQNLIPNGTKVDISTMLEDAVHYVKFLHLQIKLLCSDNLWMYAPIAYNGLDIGLDPKISHWQNGIRLKDEIAFHRV